MPSVEGAPRRRNGSESTGLRMTRRRAPLATSRADGAKAYAPPRSSMPPRADARRTTPDEADIDLRQTTRMLEGVRCLPTETANAPRRPLNPQGCKKPDNKMISPVGITTSSLDRPNPRLRPTTRRPGRWSSVFYRCGGW